MPRKFSDTHTYIRADNKDWRGVSLDVPKGISLSPSDNQIAHSLERISCHTPAGDMWDWAYCDQDETLKSIVNKLLQ